jgi:hypothetical protein
VRADRILALAAQDQMKVIDLHSEFGYYLVNRNRRVSAHCHALPFRERLTTAPLTMVRGGRDGSSAAPPQSLDRVDLAAQR